MKSAHGRKSIYPVDSIIQQVAEISLHQFDTIIRKTQILACGNYTYGIGLKEDA